MPAKRKRKTPKRHNRKLPRGLEEFEGSLMWLEYTPELLKRIIPLLDAKERKGARSLFETAMKGVAAAEEASKEARNMARMTAYSIWRQVKATHSIKVLQKATGYDQED